MTLPKAALVTGAARRIGRAIALDLAASGFDVAVHCHRSRQAAEQVAAAITRLGRQSVVLEADLARESETTELVKRASDALGPIGMLVNNASTFERDEALSATRESWDLHMEPNLRAPFVLTQQVARLLPEASTGLIVNLIDQRVWNLTPHFASYTLSKAGLWTLTRTLALALAPRLRVNAIGPGLVIASARQTQRQFDEQVASLPLPKATGLDEITAAIRFMLAAPSMTGQMIALDGGQHLAWSPSRGAPPPVE
jgi:NAD(P)-dependent dehydrogenase (short-subunit alcohol dehydrogenase family)